MMNRKWLLTGFCAFMLGVHTTTFADTEVILKDATPASGFTVKDSTGISILSARGNGNVGIGKTSPTELLDVAGNIAVGKTGINGVIRFARGEDGAYQGYIGSIGGDFHIAHGGGGANMIFKAGNSASEAMRISKDGNVGIDASNALFKLHIRDGIDKNIAISGVDFGTGGGVSLNAFNDANNQRVPMQFAASKFYFHSGNVGIGTTNPGAKLHVNHIGANDNFTFLKHSQDNQTTGYLCSDPNSSTLAVRNKNNSDVLVVTQLGNVGIGTANPGYKLHVVGSAYSTGGWSGSDRRWKKDITPLANSLSNVLKLHGVNYFWKVDEYPGKGFTKEKQIGFIAQEVEGIFPELVHTDAEGYKAVSYEKLTVVLVEAVKELKAENEQVKSQNHQLSQEVAQLREEFLALKAQQESFKAMLATDINPQLNTGRTIE